LFEGIEVSTINDCLDVIKQGPRDKDGKHTNEKFGPGVQGARWVGKVMIDVLGINETRAKKIIKLWLESGLLVECTYEDTKRKDNKGIDVDDSKRPGGDVVERM